MEKNLSLNNITDRLLKKAKSYLTEKEVLNLQKAIDMSAQAHGDSQRKSGELYISHPLSAALLLTDLMMDSQTLIAAVLHDTLEDTELAKSEIRKAFGPEILSLVESVTKLSTVRMKKSWFPFGKIQKQEIPEFERQIESLRKMLVAMAEDVRVILIKLADKIHNLKTLEHLPTEKRERIAKEAIEIYAPIAQRLGIASWQGQIEDLAFPYALPLEYESLKKMTIPEIKIREQYLKSVEKRVREILEKNSIKAHLSFRAKKWYSLYKKLQKYDGNLSKIYDLIAFRVIVNSVEDCYAILGVIHSYWKPLPGRIKDYIALPKPNGYQSLHTTVFCDGGQIVEFQIRTKQMDYSAKYGIASHWVYKSINSKRLPDKNDLKWLRDFYNHQKNIDSPEELAKSLKTDLFQDRIFVFTPSGDVKDLPRGATPIDFAYSVHSDLGDKCAGSIVNGKMVSLDTILQNGDIVEIVKKSNSSPKTDWLKFVKTQGARSHIKKYLKM